MVKIAVTGGIACGKSLVGRCLRDAGFAVWEADDVAHALMEPGQAVHDALVAEFGKGILSTGGTIDRDRLGGIVFRDPAARARVNAIVHPAAKDELARWMRDTAGSEAAPRGMAAVVPLLYEAGWAGGWDAVICVFSRRQTQVERLVANGKREEDACRRIAAQEPVAGKAARADYVIVNEGTQDSVREQTARILRRMVEK